MFTICLVAVDGLIQFFDINSLGLKYRPDRISGFFNDLVLGSFYIDAPLLFV